MTRVEGVLSEPRLTPLRASRVVPATWHPVTLWTLGFASAGIAVTYLLWLAHLPQMDFQVYRMGGAHVFGSGLYTTKITVLGWHLLFTYTPFAALIFWPFSHLSVFAGQTIWDLLDLGALAALIAVSLAAARGRGVERSDWRVALIAMTPVCFLLFPVRETLALGQVNTVLVLMIVTDLTIGVSWRGRRLPRGVLVGLAAAVKLTPLIFIPYLLAARQWRAARTALCSFAVATAAAFAVNPAASWIYFRKDAFDLKRVGNADAIGNQALHGAVARAHLPLSAVCTDLAIAVVLCAGVVTAAAAFRRSSAVLGILVCAATGLLVSPISWEHHYVWVVPVLIWLLVGADRPAGGAWWACAGAFCFIVIPPITAGGTGVLWYLRDDAYVVAALAFISLVAVMLVARSTRAAAAAHVTRGSSSSVVTDATGARAGSLV